jgi:hypothetical protein
MEFTASSVYDLVAGANSSGIDELFILFAYEGFNPEMVHEHFAKILTEKSITKDEYLKDLKALITLGAMKGNYTLRNAGKISDAGRAKADALYKKYNMKVGGLGTDRKAIILPRVLSAFPELTARIILKAPPRDFGTQTGHYPKIMKNPVFPALVPKTLPGRCARALLYLYCVYSAHQSLAISQEKDYKAAFDAQMPFITIAFNSSVPPEKTRIAMLKGQKESLLKVLEDSVDLTQAAPAADKVTSAAFEKAVNELLGKKKEKEEEKPEIDTI